MTFRGNVQTRLRKLAEGEADATFLALAGLNRMDMQAAATQVLAFDQFLPAPAQGAVTVEIRSGDDVVAARLAPLHCHKTALAVTAERAFLAALDGSCRTPIAAYAEIAADRLQMRALLLSFDGSMVFARDGETDATLEAAAALGQDMGVAIRGDAGEAFFAQLKSDIEAEIQ